ncbi:MAG: hypothetical protein AAF745_17855, partial [Planctomycetota bacterium]
MRRSSEPPGQQSTSLEPVGRAEQVSPAINPWGNVGAYTIGHEIGRGAFCVVFAATDRYGHEVAIKLPHH